MPARSHVPLPLVPLSLITAALLTAGTVPYIAHSTPAHTPRSAGHDVKQQGPINNGKTWLERLNWLRSTVGAAPVKEDPALSKQAELHANYMAINDELTHEEDPKKPGYTKEGDQAGRSSNVSQGWKGMSDLEMLDTWATAPFHTIGLLRPQLTTVGYARKGNAHGRDYAILNVLSGMNGPMPRDGWPKVYPNGPGLPYPAYPGEEWPDPIAPHCDKNVKTWGVPIIADWGGDQYRPPKITSAKADFFADGKPVETCVALAKDYPATPWALDTNRVLVLPKGAFVNGVKYTGSVTTNLGVAKIDFSVQLEKSPNGWPFARVR